MEPRPCTRCDGSGKGSTLYPTCRFCKGTGYFDPPNLTEILQEIVIKGRLRSSRPKDIRAYYVWRMARFHGGKDLTFPGTASMLIVGDPFIDELDQIADAVAKRAFGTDMAAALRWRNIL